MVVHRALRRNSTPDFCRYLPPWGADSKPASDITALSLEHYYAAFFILGVGLLSALTAFCWEMWAEHQKRKKIPELT